MGEGTKIEWARHTFNPWWGCVKVSEACAHCYAETFAKRTGNAVWGKDAGRRTFGDKHWNEPLKWNRQAAEAGELHRVFCASMADVFEARSDLDGQRQRLWDLVWETPNLIWLLLTKRPENILKMVPKEWLKVGAWPDNVWVGTTAENQKWADQRIPELVNVPAPVRFLSMEPLLGPVELAGHLGPAGINWVIVGGESGGGARPMDPDWVNGIYNDCATADVPFFFKQWGEWMPGDQLQVKEWPEGKQECLVDIRGWPPRWASFHAFHSVDEDRRMFRVGKKRAGRRYSEMVHNAVPERGVEF